MRDKEQLFIFNDAELSLIKNTFAENDELLYAVRKVLLQFERSDDDKKLLSTLTPEVLRILKKRMLPELGDEFPIGQLSHMLTTLTNDIKSKSLEDMELLFKAKELEIEYLEQQFAVLANGGEGVEFLKLKDFETIKGKQAEEAFVGVTVYLFLLGYIDPMLNFLKSIAGKKTETIEEAKERMTRNSSK